MYPTIEIFSIKIHTFGLLIALTWLLFIILLHHFSWKRGFTRSIFSDGMIVSATIAILLFGRIGYLFTEWRDEQFIIRDLLEGNILDFAKLFFAPGNYNFSLVGGIVGFLMVFFWKTRSIPRERAGYFDVVVMAFLISSLLGYFASLLGGQIYGIPFDSIFSAKYDHKESIVDIRSEVFLLPVFYMIGILAILFTITRFERKTGDVPPGFIGYLSLGLYGALVFLGEFLSGSDDMFESYLALNLNQIGSLIAICISIVGILRNVEKKI